MKPVPSQPRLPAASLAQHYRAIGPAAVLAALICMPRTRVRRPLSAYKAG
ncbi:MAG: transcriptional regulator [Rhizobiaceae bacterium]|nr:transcriptional regulator [Rhizobiaceae bacterium]